MLLVHWCKHRHAGTDIAASEIQEQSSEKTPMLASSDEEELPEETPQAHEGFSDCKIPIIGAPIIGADTRADSSPRLPYSLAGDKTSIN